MLGSIAAVDKGNLHQIYEKWPKHFLMAANIDIAFDHDPDYYDSIIFCGMGGSATGCDILNDIIRSSGSIPSVVIRGGPMPQFVGERTAVIIMSVSGNTEEALVMAKMTHKKNGEAVCISAGGKLKGISERLGQKHIEIPNLSVPRASLPYIVMPGLKIIDPLLDNSIADEISAIHLNLERVRKDISINTPADFNLAKRIADFLEPGFTFCFTSPDLLSAGIRFKNSLNENAKMHCLTESIMEASHNEIVPFTFNNNLKPRVLLLRWTNDTPFVSSRFDKVKLLFDKIGQPFMEVRISEATLVNAIVSAIYILDYVTIHAAVARGIDPSPTPAIDILKQM